MSMCELTRVCVCVCVCALACLCAWVQACVCVYQLHKHWSLNPLNADLLFQTIISVSWCRPGVSGCWRKVCRFHIYLPYTHPSYQRDNSLESITHIHLISPPRSTVILPTPHPQIINTHFLISSYMVHHLCAPECAVQMASMRSSLNRVCHQDETWRVHLHGNHEDNTPVECTGHTTKWHFLLWADCTQVTLLSFIV